MMANLYHGSNGTVVFFPSQNVVWSNRPGKVKTILIVYIDIIFSCQSLYRWSGKRHILKRYDNGQVGKFKENHPGRKNDCANKETGICYKKRNRNTAGIGQSSCRRLLKKMIESGLQAFPIYMMSLLCKLGFYQ